eukprot:166324-Hanusia_phi.AAC.4
MRSSRGSQDDVDAWAGGLSSCKGMSRSSVLQREGDIEKSHPLTLMPYTRRVLFSTLISTSFCNERESLAGARFGRGWTPDRA